MKKQNQVANKSFNFAKRIYFLYKFLKEEKKEYILSKQILRSGTSIGANVSFRFHPSPYHSGFQAPAWKPNLNMKSRYKILLNDDSLYFLTLNVIKKIPVFTNSSYMNIILENFAFYRKNQHLKIFSYVIMDNHIHLIVSHSENLSKVIQNFKSYSAKKIIERLHKDKRDWILKLMSENKPDYKQKSNFQFWQEGNHPKQIQGIKMLNQKIEYIHYNPVKRGLVAEEKDWVYSSASNFLGLESVFQVDEIE